MADTETNGQLPALWTHLDTLERERRKLQESTFQLERQVSKLVEELDRMKQPPQVVGIVNDILPDGHIVVRNANGMNFLVNCSPQVLPNLEKNMRVSMNQHSLAITGILPDESDPYVSAAEIIEKPNISFSDIGGLDEQITELNEIVELSLKKPHLFEKMGIEPPKGILLFGPPGCGKTLLAKAVARDCDAAFIRVVGSELVRKFIGEGAKLVADVFKAAREKAPTILFIDEIDAIGAVRMEETTGGDREVNRTLIQLLAEMDGFEPLDNVKIIGATNRIDILDPALLRAGRFDRIIEVPMPTEKARREIFGIHTRKMKTDASLDWLAKKSDGSMGADIRAVCTEAGIFAIRESRDYVTREDFGKALEKVLGEDDKPLKVKGYA